LANHRILLVDDEVAVLLTMKTILEMAGFEVETAASAREARSKLKLRKYQMVMTDMRMENDAAGREVIRAARAASYHPAVALLTAYPDDEWADIGADKMLVKPMQTAAFIQQVQEILEAHSTPLQRPAGISVSGNKRPTTAGKSNGSAKCASGKGPAGRKRSGRRPLPRTKSPAGGRKH
jgi:DNA-binding response OmpR family regulator